MSRKRFERRGAPQRRDAIEFARRNICEHACGAKESLALLTADDHSAATLSSHARSAARGFLLDEDDLASGQHHQVDTLQRLGIAAGRRRTRA